MSNNLQWFRLYHRIIDDEKIRLLAFEDRWHFIAVCCVKADGLLDEDEGDLKWRKIAVKLGVQLRELDEIKRRLREVGLVDENLQPVAWDELQFKSDTSTERVRKYREKTKTKPKETTDETSGNVSVAAQETEADTDTEAQPRARDFQSMLDQMLKAAGIDGFRAERSTGLLNIAPIVGLLDAGFDFDKDILPAIRSRNNRTFRPKTWGYYVEVVRDFVAARNSAGSVRKQSPPEIDWADWCEAFFADGTWKDTLGPRPGEAGCRAPAEVVEQARKAAA